MAGNAANWSSVCSIQSTSNPLQSIQSEPPGYTTTDRLSTCGQMKYRLGKKIRLGRGLHDLLNRLCCQFESWPSLTAKNLHLVAAGVDFPSRPALRRIGPAAAELLKIEKQGCHLPYILPIGSVVSLQHDESVSDERAMNQRKELSRQQSPVHFLAVAVRLRMIEMHLSHASRRNILSQELICTDYRQPHVDQTALVRPPRRIPNHYRQDFNPDVVHFRSSQ